MSRINAIDNFETGNIEFNIENLDPYYTDLYIGFTNQAPVIEFKDLKFRFELRQGTSIVQYGMYPPPGVLYVKTDQLYIVTERLTLRPGQNYTLWLMVENDNTVFQNTIEFTPPMPPQSYPSWAWIDDCWKPPVAYPRNDPDNLYVWSEETLNWILPNR
jgi:hypothetical protein